MSANGFSSRFFRSRSRLTIVPSSAPAGEVKAADPLDRHNVSAAQAVRCMPQSGRPPAGPSQLCQAVTGGGRTRGSTRAGHGTGAMTGSSYSCGRCGHRGKLSMAVFRSVVGHRGNDGVAGPRIGTIDKCVAGAAVGRVAHLSETGVADRGIGGYIDGHAGIRATAIRPGNGEEDAGTYHPEGRYGLSPAIRWYV